MYVHPQQFVHRHRPGEPASSQEVLIDSPNNARRRHQWAITGAHMLLCANKVADHAVAPFVNMLLGHYGAIHPSRRQPSTEYLVQISSSTGKVRDSRPAFLVTSIMGICSGLACTSADVSSSVGTGSLRGSHCDPTRLDNFSKHFQFPITAVLPACHCHCSSGES
ncbi:uncharacterized protein BO80DRAFT_254021 [Aspergillus ibericus CBS 121593]|uniref:Uncharacterized protein n=1 Tax=Aspergillus ibericus CBS 121593 TaxID=1448316 RepID=A0A395H8M6_9EURO|nr:hypothetical protein BO80DRAFT_254021 [Aspergillus ibericus CBS 121593]RAL04030.1 hypothetical protein BO80DRAFT_254021 [Aspergillus ibericus CBS 121593]